MPPVHHIAPKLKPKQISYRKNPASQGSQSAIKE